MRNKIYETKRKNYSSTVSVGGCSLWWKLLMWGFTEMQVVQYWHHSGIFPHIKLFLIWGLKSCLIILHFRIFSPLCSVHFLPSTYNLMNWLDINSFSGFHILMVLLRITHYSFLIIMQCRFQAQPLEIQKASYMWIFSSCSVLCSRSMNEFISLRFQDLEMHQLNLLWDWFESALFLLLTFSEINKPPKFRWCCLTFGWYLDNVSTPWLCLVFMTITLTDIELVNY